MAKLETEYLAARQACVVAPIAGATIGSVAVAGVVGAGQVELTAEMIAAGAAAYLLARFDDEGSNAAARAIWESTARAGRRDGANEWRGALPSKLS